MYKVKDAADQLGVTRVEVFEVLLSQRDQYEPYVVKKNSITYISEEGLNLLREHFGLKVIKLKELPTEDNVQVKEVVLDELETSITVVEPENEHFWTNPPESKEFTPLETDDESIGRWLNEIQSDSELSFSLDSKLKDLRTQVTGMRNKLLVLDSEIKRKDEALKHYHEIMKDDIQWLEDLERKLHIALKFQVTKQHMATIEEGTEEDDEKNNFFKFFKR